jgi:hypothetical protein
MYVCVCVSEPDCQFIATAKHRTGCYQGEYVFVCVCVFVYLYVCACVCVHVSNKDAFTCAFVRVYVSWFVCMCNKLEF